MKFTELNPHGDEVKDKDKNPEAKTGMDQTDADPVELSDSDYPHIYGASVYDRIIDAALENSEAVRAEARAQEAGAPQKTDSDQTTELSEDSSLAANTEINDASTDDSAKPGELSLDALVADKPTTSETASDTFGSQVLETDPFDSDNDVNISADTASEEAESLELDFGAKTDEPLQEDPAQAEHQQQAQAEIESLLGETSKDHENSATTEHLETNSADSSHRQEDSSNTNTADIDLSALKNLNSANHVSEAAKLQAEIERHEPKEALVDASKVRVILKKAGYPDIAEEDIQSLNIFPSPMDAFQYALYSFGMTDIYIVLMVNIRKRTIYGYHVLDLTQNYSLVDDLIDRLKNKDFLL